MRSGNAGGLESQLHSERSKYSDWEHQEVQMVSRGGIRLPEKHRHWCFRETFREFVRAKKSFLSRETTDSKVKHCGNSAHLSEPVESKERE